MDSFSTDLARLFRAKSGRLLATLISQCADIQLAEDALQEAFMQASLSWVKQGRPANPEAWLFTVARRRLIDRLRKTSRERSDRLIREIQHSLEINTTSKEGEQVIPDERLKLIFTCCHPALSQEARIALTLKTLCGLGTKEIARAFLIAEPTLQQRLVRAKRKIKSAGIAYRVPAESELIERIDSVLLVIYMIFNESYSAYEGQTLTRKDLAEEAIRLAQILYSLLPRPDVAGLLSLMLIHHSRIAARSDSQSTYIPLEQQDRSLWDQNLISKGRKLLLAALAQGAPEKYQIQAAISALHAEAQSWAETDWQQILLLYMKLLEHEPSPVTELNMAVALAQSGKLEQALGRINGLAPVLHHYQPYFAARADLNARLGLTNRAKDDYQKAISMTKNTPERDFLLKQKVSLDY